MTFRRPKSTTIKLKVPSVSSTEHPFSTEFICGKRQDRSNPDVFPKLVGKWPLIISSGENLTNQLEKMTRADWEQPMFEGKVYLFFYVQKVSTSARTLLCRLLTA